MTDALIRFPSFAEQPDENGVVRVKLPLTSDSFTASPPTTWRFIITDEGVIDLEESE